MDDKTMREAFEAWYQPSRSFTDDLAMAKAHEAGYRAGYASGMERAAAICDAVNQRYAGCEDSAVCADAIRAEIKGANL